MLFEKLLSLIKILSFIDKNPNCSVPRIRNYLEIQHIDPPSQEEKNLYKNITLLSNNQYINKGFLQKRELGGAHFTLIITALGQHFLKQIGNVSEYVDPKEKARLIDDLNTSIRIAIQTTLAALADKIPKPLKIELVPELSSAIEETLQTTFKNILFIEQS